MKALMVALLLLGAAPASRAQATLARVQLPYGATLTMRRVPFRTAGQKLEYSSFSGLALNGQPVYGTDGEPPRYKLAGATLLVHGTRYPLPVSKLYNPWLGVAPNRRLFRFAKQRRGYELWALFSNGAGGYAVKWQLAGKTATRTVLSKDEHYFF